jgi:GNAT superfamily N-acetyltransferase
MTYLTLVRRVQNPGLPLGLRYAALRSAVEYRRRIGYHATWEFITGTDSRKAQPLDAPALLEAVARMETSRNTWLAELNAYAERRTALKRDGVPADREESLYRRGRRWPGPDSRAATVIAVAHQWTPDWRYDGPAEFWESYAPLKKELAGFVDAFLGMGLDAAQRRRLPALAARIEDVHSEHMRHFNLWRPTARLGRIAELIRYETLPLVRRGWAGDAEAITGIFWAARSRMSYLPTLHTFEQTRWWVANIMASQSELWVAEMRGVPVGFAALQGDWLDHLYLDPAHQGQGIGEALLAKAKRRRRELRLHVFEQNTGARAFYARHGFTVVGGGSDNEEGLPDLEMRWRR